jgi:hypothetical protein
MRASVVVLAIVLVGVAAVVRAEEPRPGDKTAPPRWELAPNRGPKVPAAAQPQRLLNNTSHGSTIRDVEPMDESRSSGAHGKASERDDPLYGDDSDD